MATEEELKLLPLSALVTFAARCARRVHGLFRLPDDHPGRREHEGAVTRAVETAERAAAIEPRRYSDVGASLAAVHASAAADEAIAVATGAQEGAVTIAAKTAAAAARAASSAAQVVDAASAALGAEAAKVGGTVFEQFGERAVSAAKAASDYAVEAAAPFDASSVKLALAADYETLRHLGGGHFKNSGEPIDPSESGPLGPLWPDGEPEWLRHAPEPIVATAGIPSTLIVGQPTATVSPPPPAPIEVYFDVAEFSDEEIAKILGRFSDLYHALSDDVLVINKTETLDPSMVLVPEGV
jgi:hypothetical protein